MARISLAKPGGVFFIPHNCRRLLPAGSTALNSSTTWQSK
jgi:hypothetical protein